MAGFPAPFRPNARSIARALILSTSLLTAGTALAQQGLQPGEAYVTRFSGTQPGAGAPTINTNGTVGSIIDVRSPGKAPQGSHWVDEPQPNPVTAGQVGQVFGVALDDANPPNVYLSATSAFGLHRTADGNNWMPGMWGQGGGPGAIYRLDAANGYAPRVLTQVTLNGRQNSGPALGNIAYDRTNKQLFVSDLETGMIHRIRASDGADLGSYDHGTQGRPAFLNAELGQQGSLVQIGFDPNSSARIGNCDGKFDQSPQCWNFTSSGRRVWGLGVHRNPSKNEVRLYYSVWSGPAFGDGGWGGAQDDDKRNSVWSVQIGADGNFAGNVRREFVVPDFFVKPDDIARAGYSQPVSDITFSTCGPRPIMLIAERGGIRNLGLAAENPFANPHEARALRYELDQNGVWRAVGRYDVGFYDRQKDGQPFINANCSGGIAFGLGYNTNTWVADPAKTDQFVWMSGDYLCSPEGQCNLPGARRPAGGTTPQNVSTGDSPLDDSQVHGIQGMAENAFDEVSPDFAKTTPSKDNAVGTPGLNQSYLIDTDINVDQEGRVIEQELLRNDATKIGDIAIYEPCEGPSDYAGYYLVPSGGTEPEPTGYHYRTGSHSRHWSHNRFGSHNAFWSHNRRESHDRRVSHWRWGSHDRRMSHRREGSHERQRSHWRTASHDRRASHDRTGSHNTERSHSQKGSHNTRLSHSQTGSHNTERSHSQKGSHNTRLSHSQKGSHNQTQSHSQKGSHNQTQSHSQKGSHNQTQSHSQKGSHSTAASNVPRKKTTPPNEPKKKTTTPNAPAKKHIAATSKFQ